MESLSGSEGGRDARVQDRPGNAVIGKSRRNQVPTTISINITQAIDETLPIRIPVVPLPVPLTMGILVRSGVPGASTEVMSTVAPWHRCGSNLAKQGIFQRR